MRFKEGSIAMMNAAFTQRYYRALAKLLDGIVLRSHERVARRQPDIQLRAPEFLEIQRTNFESLFLKPPPIALDHIRGDAWEKHAGLWRRDFAFPSAIPSAYANNRHAIVQTYANDRGLHFPAVITLHGLMTPTLIAHRPFFRAILEAGASSYALELPYHLRRTPPGFVSGELFFTADLETTLLSLQQAVAEVRQLIHYLREAGAPVIGLLGFSLGAWISALAASCEPEVDFALFAMPPSHLNDVLWQTRLGAPIRQRFESAGWNAADTAPFYHPLDPLHLSPLLPIERRELFAAEFDHFIPFHYTQKLQRAWRHPHLRVYSTGHIGLLWSRKFLRDVRHVVAQQLSLGRRQEQPVTVVTEAAVQSLPLNIPPPISASEARPLAATKK
jgi:hypothetical protein